MTAISILLKASILISFAAVIHELTWRRTSAAARHLMWSLTAAGLLLLPVLSLVLPSWTAYTTTAHTVILPPESMGDRIGPASDHTEVQMSSNLTTGLPGQRATRATMPWSRVFTIIYAAGVVFLLGRLVLERFRIQRAVLNASKVNDAYWKDLLQECASDIGLGRNVNLFRSRQETMPMAVGIRNGTVVFPSVADTWTEDRKRAVLLHELAHVSRHDCLTQMIAAVVCAFYWVHPGAWWIARRLRIERELACDDRVLSAGAGAREYASHLLELAYALRSGRPPVLAVSMVGSGQLEGRMLALLDAARNRAIPALRGHIAGLVILLVVLVPLSAATIAVSRSVPTAPALQSAKNSVVQSLPDPNMIGTWEIRPTDQARVVQVYFREGRSSHSSSIDMDHTDGFPIAQYQNADGPVQFSVTRDAGTFVLEGIVRHGVGAGTYSFTPSPTFPGEFARRGFDRPSAAVQRVFARADIGFAYLDELSSQGYAKPTNLVDLVAAAQHGINLGYLREMGRLGYRLGQIGGLIELQNHGVSPQFIREMAAEGLPKLSTDDLLRARGSGVDAAFTRDLTALGYPKLSLDDLIRLRQHGVDPEFVRELTDLGYARLSLDRLVELRAHGVDPQYASELGKLGYPNISLDSLIELRQHGVDPEYIREFQSLGYANLRLEDFVTLRNSGVSQENARRANERAGRRLTVQDLRALAARGWK